MAFLVAGLGAARTFIPRSSIRTLPLHRRPFSTNMVLSTGTKLPLEKELMELKEGKPTPVLLSTIFAGKKVVMFSIPGALTPTCTDSHAPEYIAALPELTEKGVDAVVCLSVNDPFVMSAYQKKVDADASIRFLADGDASLVKTLGIDFDTGAFGGVRAQRGSFVVEDGVFTNVNLEGGGGYDGPAKVATVLEQL